MTSGTPVEATPDSVVEATPDTTVRTTLDTGIEATPDTVVEATPDTDVEATPDAVVEATPDTSDHWPANCDCSLMPRCFPHGWAHPFYTAGEQTGCTDHYHHDQVGENA